jgi:prepilin-type processing-associated H-X9-DG protein
MVAESHPQLGRGVAVLFSNTSYPFWLSSANSNINNGGDLTRHGNRTLNALLGDGHVSSFSLSELVNTNKTHVYEVR